MIIAINDIKNLILFFSARFRSNDEPLIPHKPSNVDFDLLEEWQEHKEGWPEFIIQALDNDLDEILGLDKTGLARYFWTKYFNSLDVCNDYVYHMITNYIIMHDLLGLIRSKNLVMALWDHWIGFEEQLSDIKTGRLTLSGLAQEHENFNNLKTKTLNTESDEAESWCDLLLIRKNEEMLGFEPFDENHLYHYVFKLLVGAKWRSFTRESGEQQLDFLKKELSKEIEIPSFD